MLVGHSKLASRGQPLRAEPVSEQCGEYNAENKCWNVSALCTMVASNRGSSSLDRGHCLRNARDSFRPSVQSARSVEINCRRGVFYFLQYLPLVLHVRLLREGLQYAGQL